MKSARTNSRAFTLIELMLVVAILGIALTMGYPSIAKALHRAPLSKATMDVMEGCREARRLAIWNGKITELRIFADHIEVGDAPADADPSASALVVPSKPVYVPDGGAPKSGGGFSAELSDKVAIQEMRINLVLFNLNAVSISDFGRVRFYPNGTSDEFTLVLFCDNERRRITLESVTALAGVEMIQ